MHSRWSKAGHTKEEVKRFIPALEALKEIIEQDLKRKESVRDYSPGWEYKQVAVNEWNEALDQILKLLDVKDVM